MKATKYIEMLKFENSLGMLSNPVAIVHRYIRSTQFMVVDISYKVVTASPIWSND